MASFPNNPSDGTIVELTPGSYFIYKSGMNCWVRLDGVDNLGIATNKSDGLMSSDDFRKLQNLLIPPPQASIKGEQCDFTFTRGRMAIYSSDNSLEIKNAIDVINKIENQLVADPSGWQLHQNTYGFDFRLDLDGLLEKVDALGNINYASTRGDKGKQGLVGEKGDSLETGPQGSPGDDGANAPFDGVLSREEIDLTPTQSNRAIVDIEVEETSETEYVLKVTRANIGNPEACAPDLNPSSFVSPWLMVIDRAAPFVKKIVQRNLQQEIICKTCNSNVYYLNIDPIIQSIEERFEQLVLEIKQEKEALVLDWLKAMSALFYEQKAALCCALENCRTKYRNADDKRYLEQSRIQAAQAELGIVVDGDLQKVRFPTDVDRDCPVPSGGVDPIQGIDCEECLIKLTVVGNINGGREENATTIDLDSGNYVVEIEDCCINDNIARRQYTGKVMFGWQEATDFDSAGNPSGNSISKEIVLSDLGTFENEEDARNAYIRSAHLFSHAGGPIKAWFPDQFPDNNSGEVILCIRSVSCYEELQEAGAGTDDQSGRIYVYKNFLSQENFLGSILPFSGNNSASDNYRASDPDPGVGCEREALTTKVMFYDGPDGRSFVVLNGKDGDPENTVEHNYGISNNSSAIEIVVADDEDEVVKTGNNTFEGRWTYDGDSDGAVFGRFDRTNAGWEWRFDPQSSGNIRTIVACSADDDGSSLILDGSANFGENCKPTHELRLTISIDSNDVATPRSSFAEIDTDGNFLNIIDSRKYDTYTPSSEPPSSLIDDIINMLNEFIGQLLVGDVVRFRFLTDQLDGLSTNPWLEESVTEIKYSQFRNEFGKTIQTQAQNVGGVNRAFWVDPAGVASDLEIERPAGSQWDRVIQIRTASEQNTYGELIGTIGWVSNNNDDFFAVDPPIARAIRDVLEFAVRERAKAIGIIDSDDCKTTAVEFLIPGTTHKADAIQVVEFKAGDGLIIEASGFADGNVRQPGLNLMSDGAARTKVWFNGIRKAVNRGMQIPFQVYGLGGLFAFNEPISETVVNDKDEAAGDPDKVLDLFGSGTNVRFPADQQGLIQPWFFGSDQSIRVNIGAGLNFSPPKGPLTPAFAEIKGVRTSDWYQGRVIGPGRGQPGFLNRRVYHAIRVPRDGELRMFMNDERARGNNRDNEGPGYNVKIRRIPAQQLPPYDFTQNLDESAGDINPGPFAQFDQDLLDFIAPSPDEVEAKEFIFVPFRLGCSMVHTQVEWYERGWRTSACCGVIVEHEGQEWIIVKRSLDTDLTCGGGESLTTECVAAFIDNEGHPAIAWPTINGEEFFGKPTSGRITFVRDEEMSDAILEKINSGDVIELRGGDAAENIPIILFPILESSGGTGSS